jgi:hypothetical protein
VGILLVAIHIFALFFLFRGKEMAVKRIAHRYLFFYLGFGHYFLLLGEMGEKE